MKKVKLEFFVKDDESNENIQKAISKVCKTIEQIPYILGGGLDKIEKIDDLSKKSE